MIATYSLEGYRPIISANGRDFACAIPDWGVLSLPSYVVSRFQLMTNRFAPPRHLEHWDGSPSYCCPQLPGIRLSLEIESRDGILSETVPNELRRRLLAADELTILELLKIVHEKAGASP